ncbi:MAG: DNA replication complex subunit Gins51 [Methanobacterium sp.]
MESEELRLDEFFQRLREIQKKERSISGLAEVGDNFYNEVYNYLNKLIREIGDNPFSFSSYLHRDARRIAAEICERREYKIINSALLNIQKSQELFADNSSKNELESPALPPQNLTAEEENLYYSITNSFSKYRKETIYSLNSFKIKKQQSPSKILSERQNSENSIFKSKSRKKVPFGIEHDIESYQANEIHEPQELEDIHEIVEDTILKPSKDKNNEIKTLIVLEEIPSIMGVDREIYGPLTPQDIVTMPEANAQIIINNNKGKFIKKHEKIAYR